MDTSSEQSASLTGKAESGLPAGRSNSAPVSSAELLALNVRRILAKRGMTQAALCKQLGWQTSRIADILSCRNPISLVTLDKIAKALQTSPSTLFRQPQKKSDNS